jgi:hypothetical protein
MVSSIDTEKTASREPLVFDRYELREAVLD